MDNQIKHTITTYETPSGETVNLTLNFFLLYKVKSKHPEIYERYNEIMLHGTKDFFDSIHVMYTAYLCANEDAKYDFEEFLKLLGDDIPGVMKKAREIMGGKKKVNSATPS